jgi:uncharacterized protein (DUF1778 family)
MARTITRSAAMSERIVIRGTPDDVENLTKAARSQGKDKSAFLRDLLIRSGIFTAV